VLRGPTGGREVLVGGGIAALALILNVVMPHRMRLIGVVLLMVPQLFVLGSHIQITSLAVLWTLFTCVAGLAAHGRSRADSPLVGIMCAFSLVTAVSLLWAVPSGMNNGMAVAVRGALFLLWLREVIVVARDDPGLLDTLVIWAVPGIALQSVLTIIFRLNPDIEEQFLRSRLAVVTIGRQVEQLYGAMPNNVIYPERAGGFFVNGNQASLFGGIAALVLLIAARRTARRWLYVFAALSLAGSIFTGSKTALFVATGCAVAIIFLPHMLKGWAVLAGLPIVVFLPLVFSLLAEFLARVAPSLSTASDESFSTREQMWRGGAELFSESPFLGLGFGGWGQRIGKFTGEPNLPPHNLVVAAWADSGIAAAALAIVFMVTAIVIGLRVAAAQPTVRDRRTAVLAFCAIAWTFLHGMADNTTVYGEQLSMILVALAVGYLYAMMPSPQQESGGSAMDDIPALHQRDTRQSSAQSPLAVASESAER
jgi:O-antigen ligase